jgi:uncharacterized protein YjbJ (UPF0337 family)
MEDNPMNQDSFAGQWQQMRGTLKAWWGRLADDDFDRIGGQTDKLIGSTCTDIIGAVSPARLHLIRPRLSKV